MGTWRAIDIQTELFDMGVEERHVRTHASNAGALVAFQGMVRELNQSDEPQMPAIQSLFLEHYPTVTENEIDRIIDEASTRWHILAVRVIHRVGLLHSSEPIVLVVVCAEHRNDAFHSAQFIMDYLKTQAPFWKREHHIDGQAHWVQPKQADADAQIRWKDVL